MIFKLGKECFPSTPLFLCKIKDRVIKGEVVLLVLANCWLRKLKVDGGLVGLRNNRLDDIARFVVTCNRLNIGIVDNNLVFLGIYLRYLISQANIMTNFCISRLTDLVVNFLSHLKFIVGI